MTSGLTRRSLLKSLPIAAQAMVPARTMAESLPDAGDGETRPNIVVINLDDLDSRSLDGMPSVRAHLVDEGASFESFIVTQPGCTPSRASLLRGQYGNNHGVLRSSGEFGGFQRFHDLGHEESTVATWLQESGYRTALVGKYLNHYPGDLDPTYVPPGWDEWYSPTDGIGSSTGKGYRNYTLNENGVRVPYGKERDDYSTDVYARKALSVIDRAMADGRPLFLYVAPRAPHGPAQPAKRHKGMFADVDPARDPAFDAADVSSKPAWVRANPRLTNEQVEEIDDLWRSRSETLLAADDLVEQVVGRLRDHGALDRSYVFFTSDNGYHLGEHRLVSGKGTPYEQSIRVPLVIRGPGIEGGTQEHRLAGMADLAPTIAELAGTAVPAFVDGRSLLPVLASDPAEMPGREAILIEKYRNSALRGTGVAQMALPVAQREDDDDEGNAIVPSWMALRKPNAIYVEYETGEREFYDLTEDAAQLDNLADSLEAAATVRLSAHLAALVTAAGPECGIVEDAPYDDPEVIPPMPAMQGPDFDARLRAGETVRLLGSALDAYGNPVADDGLSWSASIRHDEGVTDLLAESSGNAIELSLPADEARGRRFLVVALTATDAFGNSRTIERSIRVGRSAANAA